MAMRVRTRGVAILVLCAMSSSNGTVDAREDRIMCLLVDTLCWKDLMTIPI